MATVRIPQPPVIIMEATAVCDRRLAVVLNKDRRRMMGTQNALIVTKEAARETYATLWSFSFFVDF